MSQTIFTPPYRVGRKLKRAILDSTGKKVIIFPEGGEGPASEFCEYLNAKSYAVKLNTKGLTLYHRIANYFTARRARIEARKEAEHKREMARRAKALELCGLAFAAASAAIESVRAYKQRSEKQHLPGGIVAPNAGKGEFMVYPDGWDALRSDKHAPKEFTVEYAEQQKSAITEALERVRKRIEQEMEAEPVVGDLCELEGQAWQVTKVFPTAQRFVAQSANDEKITRPFSDFKRIKI